MDGLIVDTFCVLQKLDSSRGRGLTNYNPPYIIERLINILPQELKEKNNNENLVSDLPELLRSFLIELSPKETFVPFVSQHLATIMSDQSLSNPHTMLTMQYLLLYVETYHASLLKNTYADSDGSSFLSINGTRVCVEAKIMEAMNDLIHPLFGEPLEIVHPTNVPIAVPSEPVEDFDGESELEPVNITCVASMNRMEEMLCNLVLENEEKDKAVSDQRREFDHLMGEFIHFRSCCREYLNIRDVPDEMIANKICDIGYYVNELEHQKENLKHDLEHFDCKNYTLKEEVMNLSKVNKQLQDDVHQATMSEIVSRQELDKVKRSVLQPEELQEYRRMNVKLIATNKANTLLSRQVESLNAKLHQRDMEETRVGDCDNSVELREKIRELEEKLEKNRSEKLELVQKVEKYDCDIASITEQLNSVTAVVDELMVENTSQKGVIQRLKEEITDSETALQSVQLKLNYKEKEIEDKDDQISTQMHMINNLKDSVINAKISSDTNSCGLIADLKRDIEALTVELEKKPTKIVEVEVADTAATTSMDVHVLTLELSECKATVESLTTELKTLEKSNGELLETCQRNHLELKQLTNEKEDLLTNVQKMISRVTETDNVVDKLQETLNMKLSEIDSVTNELGVCKAELNNQRSAGKVETAKVMQLEQSLERLIKQINTGLLKETSEEAAEVETLTKRLNEHINDITKNSESGVQLASSTDKMKVLTRQLDTTKIALRGRDIQLAKKAEEFRELNTKLKTLQSEHGKVLIELAQSTREHASIKEELRDMKLVSQVQQGDQCKENRPESVSSTAVEAKVEIVKPNPPLKDANQIIKTGESVSVTVDTPLETLKHLAPTNSLRESSGTRRSIKRLSMDSKRQPTPTKRRSARLSAVYPRTEKSNKQSTTAVEPKTTNNVSTAAVVEERVMEESAVNDSVTDEAVKDDTVKESVTKENLKEAPKDEPKIEPVTVQEEPMLTSRNRRRGLLF